MFPSPDPIERFFDPEELPHVLEEMSAQNRARRLRLYLIARSALGPEYPVVLWHVALDFTPEGEAYARQVVDAETTDEQLETMLRQAVATANRPKPPES